MKTHKKQLTRISVFLITALLLTACGSAGEPTTEQVQSAITEEDENGNTDVVPTDETPAPVPTEKPTPTPKPTPQIDRITLSCAGDCTIGTDPRFGYGSSFIATYDRVQDYSYFLKNVQRYFANDDMTIVNFEGTLTNRTTRVDKTFTFRAPPSYVKVLTKGSVEAVAFANNHCRDFGIESYNDTRETLKKAGVKYSSYSIVSTYRIKKEKTGNKYKIGMISVCGLDSYEGSKSQIASGIKKLKRRNCDLIIMSMHDGIERQYYPRESQKGLARYAIDLGANLVLGHHPHVLQGVEKYKKAYIVYSLGNFCFGGNSNPSDKDTMIARPTFIFKNGKLKVRQTVLRIIPCCLSSTTSYNNYQPTPKKGSEKKRVLSKINDMCEALGTTLKNSSGKLTTTISLLLTKN